MNNKQQIWEYFQSKDFTKFGIAGLMGNLEAESSLNPINLQNTYKKKFNMSDQEYTQQVDNKKYTNFIYDKAGYGLAQWTYWSRKKALLEFSQARNKSIGDLQTQLDFLYQELSTEYKNVVQVLKNAKTVLEASNAVLLYYEKPAKQDETVQQYRASLGQEILNELSGGDVTMTTKLTGFLSAIIDGMPIGTLFPCNKSNYSTLSSRTIEYIVIHYTGNEKKDTAKNNAKYFQGTNRNASAHFFVDDSYIEQSVTFNNKAWHCGAKVYYHKYCRNTNSIGIEMCCTAGNGKVSQKTIQNTIALTAYLCQKIGITADKVDTYILRHYDVTHKDCPMQMKGSNNKEWLDFKQKLKKKLSSSETTTSQKEVESTMTQSQFNAMMDKFIEMRATENASNYSKEAREWAEKNNIILGDEQGRKLYRTFLTREQFITILYRAFKQNHIIK